MPSASFGDLAALLTALIWAASLTVYKRFGSEVPAPFLTLFQGIVAIPCLALVSLLTAAPFPGELSVSLSLVASGLIGIILGDTVFFYALRHLTAGLTTVVQCLVPPLTTLLGFLVLGERVTSAQIAGMAITILMLMQG